MRRASILFAFVLLVVLAGGPDLFSTRANGTFQVVHGWPTLPDGFALGQTTGLEVDSKNRVLVFHRGASPIMAFDGPSGKLLASWGDGMFGSAHGLTVDHEDNVWVTDGKDHQVFKFSSAGKLLMTLGAKGVPGLDGTHFNRPTDVLVAPNGDIYVTDGYGNRRVAQFNSAGKFIRDWGSEGDQPGQFNNPHGLAMDKDGKLYVADRENSRIQIFTSEGKFLDLWKSKELGRPWGLDIADDGFLYVADGGDLQPDPPNRNRAMRLDLTGKIHEVWGSFGSADGQFYWAHDIAVGSDGAVYVCDVNVGMRAQKFVRR
jgi:peptidylamidoglycolate lyase